MGVSERSNKTRRRTLRAVSAKDSAHADHASQEAVRPLTCRPLDPLPLPLPSQPHSTGPASPKRYDNRYEDRSLCANENRPCIDSPTKRQAMYACDFETERGLFEVVCAPSSGAANLRDPPPPFHNSRVVSVRPVSIRRTCSPIGACTI